MKKIILSACMIGAAHAQSVQDAKDALAQHDDLTAYRIALPLAQNGDGEAQYLLGHILTSGRLLNDFPQAKQWYEKAEKHCATRECAERAANALGELDDLSGFTESDLAPYRARAEQGDLDAMRELIYQYQSGANIPKNDAEAAHWQEKAAQAGDAQAQIALGMDLLEQDIADAQAWFAKAAAQHPAHAYYLGLSHERAQDFAKARDYYTQAANLTDDKWPEVRQARLALARDAARQKYDAQARQWLEKSGDIAALYYLGALYQHGEAQDIDKAREYYEKAALYYLAPYNRQAQLYRGGVDPYIVLAEHALGELAAAAQDTRGAEEWYRHAASKGHPAAQYALAQLTQNEAEQTYWLEHAACAGHAQAQQALAEPPQCPQSNAVDWETLAAFP